MTLVQKLRAGAEDPMWADHCEMPKRIAAAAADRIERLEAALREIATDIEWAVKVYAIPTSPPCTAEMLKHANKLIEGVPDTAREVLREERP